MGCCSSKTNRSSSPAKPLNLEPKCPQNQNVPSQIQIKKPDLVNIENQGEEEGEKLGVQEKRSDPKQEAEEVDAILIQCGRLSRNSSADPGSGSKYSGSKRTHGFDKEIAELNLDDDDDERRRRRQSSGGSHCRRDPLSQKSGRRVSMSPGRKISMEKRVLTDLDVNSLCLFKHTVSVVSLSQKNELDVDANNAKGFVQVAKIRTSSRDAEGDDVSPINYCKVMQMSGEQLKEEDNNNKEELKTVLVTSDTLEFPRHLDVNVEAVADLVSSNSSTLPEVVNAGDERIRSGDCDELESSGSNSYVAGSQNRWISYSSSWEPISPQSSDCWTSSRSREDGVLPVSFPEECVVE